MTPPILGAESDIVDELDDERAPTATDTCVLLHTAGQGEDLIEATNAQQVRDEYPGEPGLIAHADTFFGEAGGGRLIVSKLDEHYNDLDVAGAVERLTEQHGPAQIVAPEVTQAADLIDLADYAWASNRIALLNGPANATDQQLIALAAAVTAGGEGRNASLEADTLLVPSSAGSPREVSAAIAKAGLIARSDLDPANQANPNLAAAGVNGQCRYVLGIKAERTKAQRTALAAGQVNTFKTVNRRTRAYGFLTLADLDEYPVWWDLSGSRTMMAIRARELAVAEELFGGQIDGEGTFESRYQAKLAAELAELQRIGAIYGKRGRRGYSVEVASPIGDLAQGYVVAKIVARTSPHARGLQINIARRAITQEV